MKVLDKIKSMRISSKVYNYSALIIYAVVLIAYIIHKISGNIYKATEIYLTTLFLSIFISAIGLIFAKNNCIVWINVCLPILINIPYYLLLVGVARGDVAEITEYYLKCIISSPIKLIQLLF